MTDNELRTIAASVILSGQYAAGSSVSRDRMVQNAIKMTDILLEGLNNIEPLKKRITEYCES